MTEKESGVEKIAGGLVAQGAAAALAASVGTPLAALLPVLASSLANERHKTRIERELTIITNRLNSFATEIHVMSDAKYKFINETILAILQTADERKLIFLRNAITNGICLKEMEHLDSSQLSRAIRDISAKELVFLIDHEKYEQIVVGEVNGLAGQSHIYFIIEDNETLKLFTGLISLGLVIPKGSSIDNLGRYVYSELVPTLLELVRNPAEALP